MRFFLLPGEDIDQCSKKFLKYGAWLELFFYVPFFKYEEKGNMESIVGDNLTTTVTKHFQ